MNRIFLDLGFIQIHWYSLILFVAFVLGCFIALKRAKKYNIKEEFMIDLFFYAIPLSLIGARIYFVLFHLDYYSTNILDIFKVWEGGLAIHGGIIAALIFIYFYTKKHNKNLLLILDILCISLILGQAIGRWGNFFNQEAHGGITTLQTLQSLHIPDFIIEGMYIDGNYYIPTFLFESLWCFLGFIVLNLMLKIKNLKIGTLTATYLIWYGLERFIVESMRTDSLMLGNLRIAQLVSFIMVIVGTVLILYIRKGKKYGELNE